MILEQNFCCTSASNALRYYYFLSQHYGFTMEKHKNAKHNSLKLFIHAIRTEREREYWDYSKYVTMVIKTENFVHIEMLLDYELIKNFAVFSE